MSVEERIPQGPNVRVAKNLEGVFATLHNQTDSDFGIETRGVRRACHGPLFALARHLQGALQAREAKGYRTYHSQTVYHSQAQKEHARTHKLQALQTRRFTLLLHPISSSSSRQIQIESTRGAM